MPKYIILLMPQEFLDENSDEESYSEKKSDEEN